VTALRLDHTEPSCLGPSLGGRWWSVVSPDDPTRVVLRRVRGAEPASGYYTVPPGVTRDEILGAVMVGGYSDSRACLCDYPLDEWDTSSEASASLRAAQAHARRTPT